MIRLSAALRDYRDAGSIAARIPLWGFTDERTFLTKAGSVGVGFRLRGIDVECLDPHERRSITRRLEQVLRQQDDRVRLYQYLLKRPAATINPSLHPHPLVAEALTARTSYLAGKADRLFRGELFTVLLYEGGLAQPSRLARLAALVQSPLTALSQTRTNTALDDALSRDITELHHHAETFRSHVGDLLAPQRLDREALFRLFRRLLHDTGNVDQTHLKYDTHLDAFLVDSSIECHRDHLAIGDDRVAVLTMKEPPARTFASVLGDLWTVPANLTACLEWRRLPQEKVRREIQSRRRHHFNRRVALVNYLQSNARPEEMLVDPSAGVTVDELGQALTDIAVGGHVIGECSLTLVLADRDRRGLDSAATAAAKAVAVHDGALHRENYNLFNAWLAMIPGNGPYNVRRLKLLDVNAADLSPVYVPASGERTSAHLHGQEYLAAFETKQHAPYFWNLHHHDVGHVLVQGATGSGKSFLVNFLLTHAQKYDPITVVFDLGGSYDHLAAQMGGGRWRIGVRNRDVAINPFVLPPIPEHLHFLQAFVRVLLESGDAPRLSPADEREVYDAVESLYVLDAPQRRLTTLAETLPRSLGDRLHRWIAGGPYGDWFDHDEDTLTLQSFGCFDFEGLDQYPAVLEALLFYILHRTSETVRVNAAAGRLTLCVIDEAWRFVRDATVKAYIIEALKTWRKRNAAVVLITQGGEDFGDRDLLRTVIESCPTKLFLANPNIDVDRMRELYHLNATEAAAVQALIPRRELLLKRPDIAKVLTLVDPFTERLYTQEKS